jgi:hypothetical protein
MFPLPNMLNSFARLTASPVRPLPLLIDRQLVRQTTHDVERAIVLSARTINREQYDVNPFFQLATLGSFFDLFAQVINYTIASTARRWPECRETPIPLFDDVIDKVKSVVPVRYRFTSQRSGNNGLLRSLWLIGWLTGLGCHGFTFL